MPASIKYIWVLTRPATKPPTTSVTVGWRLPVYAYFPPTQIHPTPTAPPLQDASPTLPHSPPQPFQPSLCPSSPAPRPHCRTVPHSYAVLTMHRPCCCSSRPGPTSTRPTRRAHARTTRRKHRRAHVRAHTCEREHTHARTCTVHEFVEGIQPLNFFRRVLRRRYLRRSPRRRQESRSRSSSPPPPPPPPPMPGHGFS